MGEEGAFEISRGPPYDLRNWRPTIVMQKMIKEFKPAAVIVDPVSILNAVASNSNVKTMLTPFWIS